MGLSLPMRARRSLAPSAVERGINQRVVESGINELRVVESGINELRDVESGTVEFGTIIIFRQIVWIAMRVFNG